MPIYSYQCNRCGHAEDHFRHVNERHFGPECQCGHPMEKIIVPTMVRPDIQAYQSPIDGRIINSRKQRMEDLKRSGCRPWEGNQAEKAHARSVKASEEAKFDRQIAEGAAHVLSHMDSDKQKLLKGIER